MSKTKSAFLNNFINTKYALNGVGMAIYGITTVIVLIMLIIHNTAAGRSILPTVFGISIYDHVMNFVLSYLIVIISVHWLERGDAFKKIVWFGFLVIAVNVIFETLISIGNVRDPIDIIAGIKGVLLAWLALYFISKYGIKKK